MKLYHGSNMIIGYPSLEKGRINTDFGQGFYLTKDKIMAEKWSARKVKSVINVYNLDTSCLNIKQFYPDKE